MIPKSLLLPQSLLEVKQALVSKMVCTLTNNVCKRSVVLLTLYSL